jgi:hypothetical protein
MSFLWIGLVVLGSLPDSFRVVCLKKKSGLQVLFAFFLFFCQIAVDAEMRKTRRRHRFVQIQPVLGRLLADRDVGAALSNKNFRRDYDAVRILAGLMDT